MDSELMILTKDIYYLNPDYYQSALDRIADSNELKSEMLNEFFIRFPINSLVLMIHNNEIIAFMSAFPSLIYSPETSGYDLRLWHISYFQTLKEFQRNACGQAVFIFGIKDMIEKGATKVYVDTNFRSRSFLNKMATLYRMPIKIKGREITLSKIENTLQADKSDTVVM